jgi:hypothetical protein
MRTFDRTVFIAWRGRAPLLVLLAVASPLAFAQQSPALDRFSIAVGGYNARSDTTIGASVADGMFDGDVNLEDDLGFDRRDVSPRARLEFLVGDHQGFAFDYYRYNRDSSKSLSRSLTWNGTTYNASAHVDGKLRFDFGSAAWRWWFGAGNDVFGIGLGAGYYRVRTALDGQASVNGETQYASSSSDDSGWAPLLELGWRHAFNDRWRMYAAVSGMKKNGGHLHGHVYNAAVGVEWYPWANLGFAAEYGVNCIKLQQEHEYYDDRLNLQLDGPSLFVRLRF